MELTKKKKRSRKLIKRLLYSQMYFVENFKILFGRKNPLIIFTIEDDPPSTYFNFKIKKDKVKEFEDSLNLPTGFKLSKMRCFIDEKEDNFILCLNVYRVSGLTNGMRSEWCTFVQDPEGRIRFMILEARSNKKSMDPINIITPKSKVEYSLIDGTQKIFVESDKDTFIKITCTIPEIKSTTFATREWIEANDDVYWLNGVCDRTFYNAKMATAELISIPSEQVEIENSTIYTEFIEGDPSIAIHPSSMEFVISPWDNL